MASDLTNADGQNRIDPPSGSVRLLVVGVVAGAILGALFYSAVIWTSTPAYCVKCHELRPAYDTWKTSSHRINSHGVVAECSDCHLPPSTDVAAFVAAKAKHTILDVWAHVTREEYDREAMKKKAAADIPNAACRKCHSDLLYPPISRGGMLAHRSMLYAREGYEKRCLDCHENLVHRPKRLYAFE